MQRLEVSGAVRPIYGSLGVKRLTRSWDTVCLNTACILLGIDSCKFWTVSSGILRHSSWKTSSSCLRDDGRRNLLLKLISKIDHSVWIIFTSGNYAGQGRCRSASSWCLNQDWTLLAVCMGELSCWEIASLSGNNIWTIGKITWNVHVVTGSNSTIQSNYRTSIIPRYCPTHHRSVSMFHSWNQAFRIIDFLGRFPNINSAWWEQREGRLVWPWYVAPFVRRPRFIIITPSFSLFTFVFSNQRFSNCSCTVDVGFMKLSSGSFYAISVFNLTVEFCCHLCCSSSVSFGHNALQCAAIPFT